MWFVDYFFNTQIGETSKSRCGWSYTVRYSTVKESQLPSVTLADFRSIDSEHTILFLGGSRCCTRCVCFRGSTFVIGASPTLAGLHCTCTCVCVCLLACLDWPRTVFKFKLMWSRLHYLDKHISWHSQIKMNITLLCISSASPHLYGCTSIQNRDHTKHMSVCVCVGGKGLSV